MTARAHRKRLLGVDIDDVVSMSLRVHGVGGAAEPAIKLAAIWRSGLPIGHRGEMRERRLVVADAMHDREMAVLVETLEPRHGRLKAEMLIDLAQAFLPDADARPGAVVGVIAIGHDRVEAVVAAGQFDHHQDATVLRRLRGGRL